MRNKYNRVTTDDLPMDSSFAPIVERATDKIKTRKKINAIGKSTEEKMKQRMQPQYTFYEKTNEQLKARLSKNKKELEELERINEENIRSYRYKSKRNRFLIVLLSVLLAIAITTIAVYLVMVKLETNCEFYVHGADATFYLDGEEMSRFRSPSNIQGNARLEIDVELKFEKAGTYEIKFIAKCYEKGQLMNNTLIYEFGQDFYEGSLFYGDSDGYYYSYNSITVEKGDKILLCKGVILDNAYEHSLNVENFKMDFHVYCTKV